MTQHLWLHIGILIVGVAIGFFTAAMLVANDLSRVNCDECSPPPSRRDEE